MPLKVSDPDGDLGELLCEGIDLDAQHHLRPDPDVEGELPKVNVGQEEQRFLLELVEQFKGDVEEIAGATGRIEHPISVEVVLSEFLDGESGIPSEAILGCASFRFSCLLKETLDGG